MRKQELRRLRLLKATNKMMQIAAADKPQKQKSYYQEYITYKQGLYMRSKVCGDILVVAFYLVENLRAGGRNPSYVLYVNRDKEQFITFDAIHDKWRTAMVSNIPWPGYVRHSEKDWISPSCLKTIREYIGSKRDAYHCLQDFQYSIRMKERLRRYKKETDPWDEDLAQVPALPKDWERWTDKVGNPVNYIFYHYVKRGAKTGYCTYCEKDVPIKRPRHNKRGLCPCCHHKITYKAVGRAGIVMTGRRFMYLIQRCADGFVIREFIGYRRYPKGEYEKPERSCSEVRRAIYDKNGTALRAYFWGDYKHHEFRWKPCGTCSASYWGNDAGRVYGKSLRTLVDKGLQRTGLIESALVGAVDPEKYLAVLQKVPQLEQIGKAKLPRLVNECVYDYYNFRKKVLDIQAKSLTKMLGINTQELKRLRKNCGGSLFLDWLRYERAIGKRIPDHVMAWFSSEEVKADDLKFITGKMSPTQVYNYVRRQMDSNGRSCEEVLTTWADYLSMAKRFKMDINDQIIFRVNKLFQRHNELVERGLRKDLTIEAGKILEQYPHVDEICESLKDKYEFADKKYTVVAPSCIEDIIVEGENLHHCLSSSDRYWERIERREAFILFLRRTEEVDASYYTLEVEPNGTIRQKRTMYDRQEADIIKASKFLVKWQKAISVRLTDEDHKLAEDSRVLRDLEFAELRDKQVVIQYGDLRGKLLVDVLTADLMETAA